VRRPDTLNGPVPRLGEILVHLQLISDAQLHEGLQAQVLYGGRLGTNLVELGHLTLDDLAKALARRHRLPAALGAHFDRCDPGLQARVPAEIAGKWRAVPIGRLAQDQSRLAVAVRDPPSIICTNSTRAKRMPTQISRLLVHGLAGLGAFSFISLIQGRVKRDPGKISASCPITMRPRRHPPLRRVQRPWPAPAPS